MSARHLPPSLFVLKDTVPRGPAAGGPRPPVLCPVRPPHLTGSGHLTEARGPQRAWMEEPGRPESPSQEMERGENEAAPSVLLGTRSARRDVPTSALAGSIAERAFSFAGSYLAFPAASATLAW